MIVKRIGDLFRSKLTGTDYVLRQISGNWVILHALDGMSQMMTGKDSLDLFYEKHPYPRKTKEKA